MPDTVSVMLSSYNGERFIAEQVESILAQKDVITYITVRDDGSSDKTAEVVRKLQEKYPERINLVLGENVGYRKSFLKLLPLAHPADYYAFSDQDDYWLPEKCIVAIKKLRTLDNPVALYGSGVIKTDEKLNVIGKTDSATMPLTLESYFARQRLAGCTYVFTEKLREISSKFIDMNYPNYQMPDHDFVVGSCGFACGAVVLDHNQYIYHRRLDSSVTSGGAGIIKRIKVEYGLTFKRRNVQSTMARELLARCGEMIPNEKRNFLSTVSGYGTDKELKHQLLSNEKFTTEIKMCDMETRLKVLLGNY